jgi:hypothetical protein
VLQSGDSSTTTGALCVHDTFCFVGSWGKGFILLA